MLRPGLVGSTLTFSVTITIRVKHWDLNTWVFDKAYRPNASPLQKIHRVFCRAAQRTLLFLSEKTIKPH